MCCPRGVANKARAAQTLAALQAGPVSSSALPFMLTPMVFQSQSDL